jgi:3-methyl-2-oxobutanoate hydroxymethyltransferase
VTAEPVVMLTAYTARTAQLLDAHCDMLLVGDSLAQVIYGLDSTIPVTLDMMCNHGAAVVRGSYHSVVVVDMPFGSYEASPEKAYESAAHILKETGAAAVKLEGGEVMAETVAFLVQRGIPVVGHVGLTPQAINVLGGYAARGRSDAEAKKIVGDAVALDKAGRLRSYWKVCWSRLRLKRQRLSMPSPSASARRRNAMVRCWSRKICSACSTAPLAL